MTAFANKLDNSSALFKKSYRIVFIIGVLFLSAVLCVHAFGKLIIYNPTASVPEGFYRYAGKQIQTGSIILFDTPDIVKKYTQEHHNTKSLDHFLKPVLAVGGDRVCYENGRFFLNAEEFSGVQKTDSYGNDLPIWAECRVLMPDEVFVYSDRIKNSFDSRYYGPVKKDRILGVFVPL